MDEQPPNLGYGSEEEMAEGAADASVESEGVGGATGLDAEQRSTVSDVDGDNVDEDRPTSKS